MICKKNKSRTRNLIIGASFLWTAGLLMYGCAMTNSASHSKADQTKTNQASANGTFDLQTAQQAADTLHIRQVLTGNWKLDRICRSTFAGLKCDSSIQQIWQLDSLGGIRWITQGDNALRDQYHFVSKQGAQAGTTKGRSVWVMYLEQARRGYLIRTLTKDSLSISDYPLIMDKTTTYYLTRQQ